jgi:hypothetical protein
MAPRFEFDLFRALLLSVDLTTSPAGENDWVLECIVFEFVVSGDGIIIDLGRVCVDCEAGDGEGVFLENGVFRHFGPFGAGTLMFEYVMEV